MGTVILADVTELTTIKISELADAVSIGASDVFPVVKGAETQKIARDSVGSTGDGFSVPSELTISSGSITVSGSAKFRFHSVDTESDAVTDDLETIAGGAAGDMLILQAVSNDRTVVCKEGTSLKLQYEFTLNNIEDKITLLCISSGVWHELSRAGNGS